MLGILTPFDDSQTLSLKWAPVWISGSCMADQNNSFWACFCRPAIPITNASELDRWPCKQVVLLPVRLMSWAEIRPPQDMCCSTVSAGGWHAPNMSAGLLLIGNYCILKSQLAQMSAFSFRMFSCLTFRWVFAASFLQSLGAPRAWPLLRQIASAALTGNPERPTPQPEGLRNRIVGVLLCTCLASCCTTTPRRDCQRHRGSCASTSAVGRVEIARSKKKASCETMAWWSSPYLF